MYDANRAQIPTEVQLLSNVHHWSVADAVPCTQPREAFLFPPDHSGNDGTVTQLYLSFVALIWLLYFGSGAIISVCQLVLNCSQVRMNKCPSHRLLSDDALS